MQPFSLYKVHAYFIYMSVLSWRLKANKFLDTFPSLSFVPTTDFLHHIKTGNKLNRHLDYDIKLKGFQSLLNMTIMLNNLMNNENEDKND